MLRHLVLATLLLTGACASNVQPVPPSSGQTASTCKACVSSMDCNMDETCAQFTNDSNCVRSCVRDSDCASTDQCLVLTTVNGQSISGCVARDGSCGPLAPGSGPADGGTTVDDGPTPDGYCGPLAGPEVSNNHCQCSTPGQCAPNNCTNGWYCDISTDRCVLPPSASQCGPSIVPDAGTTSGAGGSGSSGGSDGYCDGLAGPSVSGTGCTCGRPGQCAANNCYNGWYCDPTSNKCVAPPATCNTPDAGSGGTTGGGTDAGPGSTPDAGTGGGTTGGGTTGPVTGSIDPHTGGTASNLLFAVVGDTRPPNVDDTSGYPTQIINGIYADLARLNPAPLFVVGTGDYMFATPGAGTAQTQLGYYMAARAKVASIPFWPAMGNHECDGYTASNCVSTSRSNLPDFTSAMLQPIGESLPYYSRTITASDNSWTAKFIWVAPNYWDSTEQSWLQQELAKSTTYTFVIHHEPSSATNAPGINAIESATRNANVTLHIVGHTHTWQQGSGEVIIGNGGAPLTGSGRYGYTLFERRPSDGAIVITAYDYSSNASFQSFAVTASGAITH